MEKMTLRRKSGEKGTEEIKQKKSWFEKLLIANSILSAAETKDRIQTSLYGGSRLITIAGD